MEIYINDKKFVIIISPKSTRFDLPIEVNKNLSQHKSNILYQHNKIKSFKTI